MRATLRAALWAALLGLGATDPPPAHSQTLLITGLPCPGGEGEPTNSHPVIWSCRCANDQNACHSWANWQSTVQVDYGDVVAVTWFDQCRAHDAAWDWLRIDLVTTNGAGSLQTNSGTVKLEPGYNFGLSYVYWYTNGGTLIPTNFAVAQVAVRPGMNQSFVLGTPESLRGTNVNPPIWLDFTNPISNPADWPVWAATPDHYPFWPPWITNGDGAPVIAPIAQLPFWSQQPPGPTNADLMLQAIPGLYSVETSSDLLGLWSSNSEISVVADGTATVTLQVADIPALFVRARGVSAAVGLGYNAAFQTEDAMFEPAILCDVGAPQEFLWSWSDGSSSSNYPFASKDFGSAESRLQHLRVAPAETVTTINLGFDGSDGGDTLPLTNGPPQGVSAVNFPYPLPGLRYWASSYNPITNLLDFTGFTSLEDVECFHCTNLQHVSVANLPSLKRICFEQCDLQELDLSNDPNLEDVRAALNDFTGIRIGGGTGPKIWHWCVRDNPQLDQDFNEIMTNFFSLRELWIWDANQGGVLTIVSTNFTDIELHENHYTYADFTGQTNLQILWFFDNQLTNLVINGCVKLQDFEAQRNQLPGPVLDSLLAFLDSSAPDLQNVDLTGNAELPSPAGYIHYANLTNRGVFASVDFPTNGLLFPAIVLDSTALLVESCLPTNNAVDPDETVTVSFALKNSGTMDTANLIVTLLQTNGITPASGAVSYGALLAGGSASSGAFTLTVTGSCGSTAAAILQLQDGSLDLGTLSVPIKLGVDTQVWSENFDGVTAPALPSGWSVASLNGSPPWVTTTPGADAGTNAASSDDVPDPDINDLISPPVSLPAIPAQLTFRNSYDLEPGYPGTADDGGVLDIKIGSNPFADILAAGGSFVAGGYTDTITNIWNNPLAGRDAWSGNSRGYINTIVNLPPSAQGETIQLRWRCATDQGNGSGTLGGWHIDTISITASGCCTNSPPAQSSPLAK